MESRPYAGESDLAKLRAFLVSLRSRTGPACWHVGDLTWRFFLHAIRFDLTETVRLWEDGSRLLGFGIVTPPCRGKDPPQWITAFDLEVDPRARTLSVAEEIVAWVDEGGRALPLEDGGPPIAERVLVAEGVYESDASLLTALQGLGFERAPSSGVLLSLSLEEPIPDFALPEGFTVRSVKGEQEIPERAAAHRDAFHPSRVTDDEYRRLVHLSDYQMNLDLVAVSPEGTIASFVLIWIDEENRAALFEPVGTRPAFQRQGLSKALLCEGLRRARALGMAEAFVGPIGSDAPALRLYKAVGFDLCGRAIELARADRS